MNHLMLRKHILVSQMMTRSETLNDYSHSCCVRRCLSYSFYLMFLGVFLRLLEQGCIFFLIITSQIDWTFVTSLVTFVLFQKQNLFDTFRWTFSFTFFFLPFQLCLGIHIKNCSITPNFLRIFFNN